MKRLLLIFLLILISVVIFAKPVTITISGFVFDESTGGKAVGQLVTLKAKNTYPSFLYFEKLLTDSSGYFTQTIEIPYPIGIFEVSTIDCYNEIITHYLTFNYHQTNLTTSFVICYNAQFTYCHSDFSFIPLQQPGAFQFKETSIGEIENWHWDFGDGNFSNKQNPTHIYHEDGNYDVCLTVSGVNGNCSDKYCEHLVVRSDSLCNPMFTYSENFGMPNTIQFWDLSQGNISEWNWDFGDGTSSLNQYPSHTYATQGSYEVCLTVINNSGTCTNTFCNQVVTGSSSDCKAMFFGVTDTTNSLTRQFMDVSYGEPTSWQWNFGDNSYSDQQNPWHTYSESGMYNVCLAIYNSNTGCSDTYCQTIFIDQQTTCSAFFNYSQISTEPFTYQFMDLSVGNIATRIWDFGDGKTVNTTNPVHSYHQSGEYHVCLTITDEQGICSDTYCETIYVGSAPNCTANFVYQQDGINPFTFNFFDSSSGDISSWHWDFGDGSNSDEQNPLHTFTEEGFYVVCLEVTDGSGSCEDQMCTGIFVSGTFACQAAFDFFVIPENPLMVQFTDASTGNIGFWFWNFGDGTVSFEQNPLHTYSANGTYNVCLQVLDFNFQSSNLFCNNVVIDYDPSCESDFSYSQLAQDPLTFDFTENSSGNIVEWFWNFGDGSNSNEQNPTHTYNAEGNYEVCLTITNFWGNCQDVYCSVIAIEIPDLCIADFSFNTIPDQPLHVKFTDLSSGIMNKWHWDFGDGFVSELQHPQHIYADTGTYEVSLSVQHSDSIIYCNNLIIKAVQVYVAMPLCQADFIATPDPGINKPNLFHFSDRSTGTPDTWLWDFGDGDTSTLQNPQHKFSDFGNYQVSLSITKFNPWGENCTDTKVLQFSSPEYFHFGGLVYAGDYPINNPTPNGDTAQVFVYSNCNSHIQPVDTNQFTNLGYFYFLNVLSSNYLIKVKLTPGSTNAPKYLPAYFGDNLKWQNASLLQLTDSNFYEANVRLVGISDIQNGMGKITGSVVHHSEKYDAMIPASQTEIMLFDAAGNPVKYCFSDGGGDFEFTNLPYGTYMLQAESTGLFTEPVMLTLTETFPSATNIQLNLYDAGITSINYSLNQFSQISISPNPVNEIFTLTVHSPQNQNIKISIFGITGIKVFEINKNIIAGDTVLEIYAGNLTKGIYFLKVVSENKSLYQTIKFIK